MATADLARLTAIIRTRDASRALHRLVKSIRRFCPQVHVLVADDGLETTTCKGVESLRLPSDKGLAASQNSLLARVRTPFVLVIDGHGELHRESQVDRLMELVAGDQLDLAGGDFIECRRRLWFFLSRRLHKHHGLLEIAGARLGLLSGARSQGDGFWWCDFVPQFYVARTDRLRAMGGWDPELADQCHEEFFYRAHRHGIRVGTCSAATLWHWPPSVQPADDRRPDHLRLAVAKMGLTEMTKLDGQVVRAPRLARAA